MSLLQPLAWKVLHHQGSFGLFIINSLLYSLVRFSPKEVGQTHKPFKSSAFFHLHVVVVIYLHN